MDITKFSGTGRTLTRHAEIRRRIVQNWQLYALLLLPVLYVAIFQYGPMYGLQIAFKRYNTALGITRSPWIGMANFIRFFHSYDFWMLIRNTIGVSLYGLVAGFPFPILLALSLNYLMNTRYKKVVQMVTYAPHFISTVVICGLIVQLLDVNYGMVNNAAVLLGGHRINFMGVPAYFKSIYVWSGVWQSTGWGSIIYLAALAGVDPQLHEAAIMDGASKFKRVLHVDLPCIAPTIIILLIMNIGQAMNVGFQKILLLQNSLNRETSEVIDTYVYNVGIASGLPNFSYVTAIGMFKSVINLVLIVGANRLARKLSDTSLW